MRTDATFDRKQVLCRNASYLGYSKGTARVGDLVFTKNGLLARMIGRIVYAPCLTGDTKPIKGYILAVAMTGDFLEHTHERWINPEHVVRIEAIRNQKQVIDWFLSEQMVKAPLQEVRQCSNAGWSTLDAMRAYIMESRKLTPAQYKEYAKQIGKQATA